VFSLNNAVGLEVIWGDFDMMNAIFLKQVSRCCYECGTVFGNNFSHFTPSAEDIPKYKVTESLLIFLLKRAPLGPRRQSTMGLNKIAKIIDSWHEHGVNINLAEKHRNVGNHQGKVKMTY